MSEEIHELAHRIIDMTTDAAKATVLIQQLIVLVQLEERNFQTETKRKEITKVYCVNCKHCTTDNSSFHYCPERTGDTYYKIEKRWADCGKRNKDNDCSGFEQKSPWWKFWR
jgi:hypothetical protein